MATFVGAEYIIANVLIALKRRKNKATISRSELNDFCIYIQKMSIEKDLDVIFLISQDQLDLALFDFSNYFEYSESGNIICINKNKQITDLASRFVGYLPWNVLAFLVEMTDEFAKQSMMRDENMSDEKRI